MRTGSFHLIVSLDKTPVLIGLVLSLCDFVQVKGLLKKKSLEVLIDPDIGMDYNYIESEVQSLIQVALLCTQGSPMDRPQMSEVVRMLEGNDGLAERCEEWQELELPGSVYESS